MCVYCSSSPKNRIDAAVKDVDVKDESKAASSQKKRFMRTKFAERSSKLDMVALEETRHEWRGWYNLLVIATCFYGTTTVLRNFSEKGSFVTGTLFVSAVKDLPSLVVADMCMVLFSFTGFILQKMLVRGMVSQSMGFVLQHVLQSTLFTYALAFIYYRDFPWLQSASFLMHTIVIFMKMHSYIQTNREFDMEQRLPTSPKQSDAKELKYPNNVTLRNFMEFLIFPTLVYEVSYPRTSTIRLSYLFEKTIGLIGTFSLMYICTEHYIIPVVARLHEMTFVDGMVALLMPFMLMQIFTFYIIFELICNILAEITMFGDRLFYEDWWNSSTFDEYARKWNKPVHEWLLRHIYIESMSSYKVSKQSATFFTFLFSSILHELVMVVTCKKLRFYFFAMQLMQLPLIYLGHLPFFLKRSRLGNFWFWIGMFTGPPILCIVYIRDLTIHSQ